MSQRSIVEINHDLFGALENNVNAQRIVMIALRRAIASGSDENWEPLRHFGIRRIIQCHHSEDRKVVVKDAAGEREYPFG